MMRSLVFVTTELPPLDSGGAGYMVARLRASLVAEGHRVRVVVAADGRVDDPDVRVVGGFSDHEERSAAVAAALQELLAAEPADLVEFQDFYALGFTALADRRRYGLGNTTAAVRFHGPMASLLDAIGHRDPAWDRVVAMERAALQMADVVLVPSAAMAEFVDTEYDIEPDRIVVAEPARAEAGAGVPFSLGKRPQLVVYGKRAEVKGSLAFVDAVAPMLTARADLDVRFVGSDSWSFAENRSITEIIKERIPAAAASRVGFESLPQPVDLARQLAGAWLVVVPSVFETFCLAAHEVRAAGLPLLVADLAAFRDFFAETTGVVKYDGTVAGMRGAMEELLSDPGRLARLAAAPLPKYSDPLDAYRGALPPVRHPQSQAGLATLAVHAVAGVAAAEPSAWQRTMRSALRLMPRPVAGLAIRVLPRRLKDRFRAVASWPEEEERRRRVARHERTRQLGVSLPAGSEPEVSVIIPCFEQGEFLMDALSSVYEQAHDSWEIIVVDDGSTQRDTIAAIDAVADWERLTIIRQANRGLPAARNAGIKVAKGRYVVPLDADDELGAGFLEEMTGALTAAPRAAFAHCWAELFGDIAAIWVTRPFNLYQLLLGNSVVGCVALRRQAWQEVGGYDESMVSGNEDWELWVRLLLAGWQQVEVRRPLFRYRRLGASMSAHTEAQFEAGRAAIAERHPASYAPEAMATMKRGWYPAVSLIAGVSLVGTTLDVHDLDDCELVVIGGEADSELQALARDKGWPLRHATDLAEGVAISRGKYLSDATGVRWSQADGLRVAAAALEADPAAYAAGDGVVWRRWALVDGASPHTHRVAIGGVANVTGSRLARGAFVDPAWRLSHLTGNLPVHRQSPEVEGFLVTL
jgi:glycosyltransferase involved in cell wall biosynthesis